MFLYRWLKLWLIGTKCTWIAAHKHRFLLTDWTIDLDKFTGMPASCHVPHIALGDTFILLTFLFIPLLVLSGLVYAFGVSQKGCDGEDVGTSAFLALMVSLLYLILPILWDLRWYLLGIGIIVAWLIGLYRIGRGQHRRAVEKKQWAEKTRQEIARMAQEA